MKLKKIALAALLFGFSTLAFAQDLFRGQVVDEHNNPLPNISFVINQEIITTDENGYFDVPHADNHWYEIIVDEYGFELFTKRINSNHDKNFKIVLKDQLYELEGVEITAHLHDFTTANTVRVDQDYINKNYAGSLSKSLENLPGMAAMGIGSGNSKPIIRGLGFNRLVVAENGVKQEGQQWGADHGLEIDPLNVENIEIIKGAGALQYGNEAIGGVISIRNNRIPTKNTTHTKLNVMYQSVNDNYLAGVSHFKRWDKFFYKFKASHSDYADFRTTTDRFRYLDRVFEIENKRMKNTAGQETNFAVQLGYTDNRFTSILNVSNFNQKVGFFAGAHGIPSASNLVHDGDYRNIDFPYQTVNHFKVISENSLELNDDHTLKLKASYQNNLREEWSAFHSHYPSQPRPTTNADLELQFKLATYDAQLSYEWRHNRNFKSIIGLQTQIQHNLIDGYSYLLPKFKRSIYSAYFIEEFQKNNNLKLSAGIRYDFGNIKINGFYDPYLFQYLVEQGNDEYVANQYALRGKNLERDFSTFNGVVGGSYQLNKNWDFSLNLGTNFRLPTAIELGANGIHHGSFRHEKGNQNLDAEQGFSADLKIDFHPKNLNISFSPYIYYFSNYIFLQPTSQFSILPHSGQVYEYTQSEALITGFEVAIDKQLNDKLAARLVYEYIYNKQLGLNKSQQFPLPFTPANNVFGELNYQLTNEEKTIENWSVFANAKYVFDQNRTAQNESPTDAYTLIGLGTRGKLHLRNFEAEIAVTVNNLLNEKYYNHTSFYKALELPEQGRNIQVSLSFPF